MTILGWKRTGGAKKDEKQTDFHTEKPMNREDKLS